MFMSFIFIVNSIKAYKNPTEKWYESSGEGYPTWIGILRVIQMWAGVEVFIASLFHVNDIIMGFINPQYGAIRDIFDFIKK